MANTARYSFSVTVVDLGARNNRSRAVTRDAGAVVKNVGGKRNNAVSRSKSMDSSTAVSDCSNRVWRGERQPK
ncbi:Uncharacterised protein [Mycobacteroides abscessus subsp. abscessus]|nr:Uncharacterised protein [Mycobacteroides abscessus subsp. abscessus]